MLPHRSGTGLLYRCASHLHPDPDQGADTFRSFVPSLILDRSRGAHPHHTPSPCGSGGRLTGPSDTTGCDIDRGYPGSTHHLLGTLPCYDRFRPNETRVPSTGTGSCR